MGSARPWLVLVVALVPAAVSADNHFADVAANGSFTQGSTLWGAQVTVSKLLGRAHVSSAPYKPLRWAAVLDLNKDWGTHQREDVSQFGYAAGLRLTLAERHNFRFLPFAHTLVGGNHNSGSTLVRDHASFVFGGGLDVLTNPRRRHADDTVFVLAFRLQGDWTEPFGVDADGYPRVSVGIVFRFGEHVFDHP
jgi:hypothetical protein